MSRKESLGRTRHRWEDTIKLDLKEIGYEGVDRNHVAQDKRPVMGAYEQRNEPAE
jgi:hypothetical protein